MKIKTFFRELPIQGTLSIEIGAYDLNMKDAKAVSTSIFTQPGGKQLLAITVLLED